MCEGIDHDPLLSFLKSSCVKTLRIWSLFEQLEPRQHSTKMCLCLRQLSYGAARQPSASVTVMENPSWQIWATPVSRTALPRDSQCRSPEISSNPDLCNLSPDPGIVSWAASPSMPHSAGLPPQWINTTQELVSFSGAVTTWGDLTQIHFSCMTDPCRHIQHLHICSEALPPAVLVVACSTAFSFL